MKASELIKSLQTAIKDWGDVEVQMEDGDVGWTDIYGVLIPDGDQPDDAPVSLCSKETMEALTQ